MRWKLEDLPEKIRKQAEAKINADMKGNSAGLNNHNRGNPVKAQAYLPDPAIARSDKMNKTELAYARNLLMRLKAGEIVRFEFEPFNLRLADGTYYRPDFVLQYPDGRLEIHEVKGFFRERDKVRTKVAAEIHNWFKFYVVKRADGGGWDFYEMN